MKKLWAKLNKRNGFTLTEALVIVAIIIILFALAIPPIRQIRLKLRQTELDAKAEQIYIVAQNTLSNLRAGGQYSLYAADVNAKVYPVPYVPSDADSDNISEGMLYYVDSADRGSADACSTVLLLENSIEKEIWNNHWVIEYNPESGSVYAVFYWEHSENYKYSYFDSLRFKEDRLAEGARVGYYGGDASSSGETKQLEPVITVNNGEKLSVRLSVEAIDNSEISFKAVIKDEHGNKVNIPLSISRSGRTWYSNIILDDLSSEDTRFKNAWSALTPGDDLYIEFTAESSNRRIAGKTVSCDGVNSLFGSREDDTLYISCGRHLQNLDEGSGVNDSIAANKTFAVKQTGSIYFIDDISKADDWYSVYGTRKFDPINNEKIGSYTGKTDSDQNTVIYGLNAKVDVNGNSGLFGTFTGSSLSEIRLADAKTAASGAQNAGALAAKIETDGTVEITGCMVYLEDYPAGMSCENYYIRAAANAGGIAGLVTGSGNLRIRDSFASSLVYSYGGNAGGLIGGTENNITVSGSYSDSYLYGYNAGGLVGRTLSGGGVSVTESYTAGFITARASGAGLVCGTMDFAQYVYTVMDIQSADDTSAVIYSTAISGSSNQNVYYIAGTNNLTGTTSVSTGDLSNKSSFISNRLSNAFTDVTDYNYTNPYNLTGKISGGLQNYSYPRINGLDHYGDWQAAFENGRLVYYEAYQDGKNVIYGFYGANVNCLRDDLPIIGDGYGMIFISPASMDITYIGDNGKEKSYKENVSGHSTKYSIWYSGKEYKLVPFVKNSTDDPVNTEYAPNSFYQKLSVKSQGSTMVFWYNPHFAKTAIQSDSCPPVPSVVEIRTARQLYDLSKFYPSYRRSSGSTYQFTQMLDIDFTESYDWANFTRTTMTDAAAYLQPIGVDDSAPFRDGYNGNGHTISGISFRSNGTLNAGLFGVSTGSLQNIIIVSDDYTGTVSFSGTPQGASSTGNIGVLVGKNSGIINNCAVAGYSADIAAYTNSTVNVGGLVGYNSGVIRNSSAVTKKFDIYNTSAVVRCGSFVGANVSDISGCYALGCNEVKESTDGSVTVAAGFAGRNSGTVSSSYCASSTVSSGTAVSYAFAPDGGNVNDCAYLFGSSFRFINELHLYSNSDGSGTAKTDAELKALALSGFGTASSSRFHSSTDAENYPYPAVVRSTNGNLVHYGDWTTSASLGSVGLFYWEHETEGSNEGYYINYLGVKDDFNVETADTLCTSHDDGGVITEYGYGYYKSVDDTSTVTLKIDGSNNTASENTEASAAYNAQFPQYEFHAFNTVSEGNTQLRTTGNKRNSEWILTYNKQGLSSPYNYSFSVSPFFGNSYSYNGMRQGSSGSWNKGDVAVRCPEKSIVPGNNGNSYEIRSVAQLQFINWNYSSGNTNTVVTKSNYKQYPYLQYTTNTGIATQTSSAAYGETERSMQYWLQTHDADGNIGFVGSFTPIAATYETSSAELSTYNIFSEQFWIELFSGGYNATLYTWFGGSYDGQSYKLKNIDITTDAVNTGLFGTTAGADMRNIVMYSDKNSVILHNGNRLGAYAVGGLIGVAYDYSTSSGHEITNCAISGYTVRDSFTGTLTPGEANMGGLIGIANVSLSGCSAVNDIIVDTLYSGYGGFENNTKGNFLRVGGLVGANVDTVKNCYSGGSIFVEDRSRMQFCQNTDKDRTKSTNIYIGGIGGSSFGANYQNFSGTIGAAYHTATYENCYTYTRLPDFGGAVRVVSTIASVADRQGKIVVNIPTLIGSFPYTITSRNSDGINIRNCYYLDSIAKISDLNGSGAYASEPPLASADMDKMLQGKISKLSKDKSTYYWRDTDINSKNPSTAENITVTSLTYSQMKDTVSSSGLLYKLKAYGFGIVTTEEKGAIVNGKYSFPGSAAELAGLNYPFPTILTQPTASGGNANVHYGEWPTGDLSWEKGIYEFDLITSTGNYTLHVRYEGDGTPSPADIRLAVKSDIDEDLTDNTVTFGSVTWADGYFNIPVHCVTEGAYRLYATYGDQTAVCMMKLSGIVNVSGEPQSALIYVDEETAIFDFAATDYNGQPLGNVTWSSNCIPDDTNVIIDPRNVSGSKIEVTAVNEGETWIEMTATYTVGSHVYTGSATVKVETRERSVIGMHDKTIDKYANTFNQIKIMGGDAIGQNTAITANKPDPGDEIELFAYAKGSEIDLSEAQITSMYVEDTDGYHSIGKNDGTDTTYDAPAGAVNDGKYAVVLGDLITAENTSKPEAGYSYLPMTLSGISAGQVTLHMTFTVGEDDYSLSIKHKTSNELVLKWYDAAGNLLGTTTGEYGKSPAILGMPDETMIDEWISSGVYNTEGHSYSGIDPSSEDYSSLMKTYMMDSENWTPAFEILNGPASYYLCELKNVTFNANGGSFTNSADQITAQIKTGQTAAALLNEAPTRDGLAFAGWYTIESPGVDEIQFDLANTLVTEDITLYAGWSANVTFDLNGGTSPAIPVQNVLIGLSAEAPSEPTRSGGYRFDGWFTTAEPGTADLPFDIEGTAITGNITLYAKWVRQWNVTFKVLPDSYDAFASAVVDDGAKVSCPENDPTFGTLPFAGWFYQDGGTEKEYDFNTPVTGDITVYGNWTVKVTFQSTINSGSGWYNTTSKTEEIEFYYGSVIYPSEMPKPVDYQTGIRTTYTFTGWRTEGSTEDIAELKLTGDIKLTAHYKQK